ncbi:MAG: oligosaccharide flippase family protein [Elusimicrobiales bacterium]|nr:oligosaccharide flippase family protein [Elusimicrobiales bacterium]
MLKDIKVLGKESLVYGLSTVGARLLNFLLMPFYTHYLVPAEYGVVAAVFSYIAFLNIVYHYGMDQAYMRHYADREKTFPAAFACLGATTLALTLLLCLFAPFWASASGIGAENYRLVWFSAAILLLDTITIVPFADLRMRHRALRFAGIRTASIALNVALNVAFLGYAGLGLEGVFWANIISSGLAALLLLPEFKQLSLKVDRPALRGLLAFALPLLPAGLGSMAVQVLDRPIMLHLADKATVGVYQANYRLGIFMMLVVTMFDQAWRPFFIERSHRPEAPGVFARVLTYFVFGGLFLWLALAFFVGDLARLRLAGVNLIHPDYWGGLGIIPLVLAAYLLNGVYVNFLAPVIIAKRTGAILAVTLAGAAVSVAGNFALIPAFGMYGAAWAVFLSYLAMAALMYFRGRRFYPVPYEFGRLAKAALAAALCAAPGLLLAGPGPAGLLLKTACLAAFPALLWYAGLVLPEEKAAALAALSGQKTAAL